MCVCERQRKQIDKRRRESESKINAVEREGLLDFGDKYESALQAEQAISSGGGGRGGGTKAERQKESFDLSVCGLLPAKARERAPEKEIDDEARKKNGLLRV